MVGEVYDQVDKSPGRRTASIGVLHQLDQTLEDVRLGWGSSARHFHADLLGFGLGGVEGTFLDLWLSGMLARTQYVLPTDGQKQEANHNSNIINRSKDYRGSSCIAKASFPDTTIVEYHLCG